MKVNISIDKEKLKEKLGVRDGLPGQDGAPGPQGEPGPAGKDADITEAVDAAVSAVTPLIPKIEDIEKNLPKLGEPIRDALELLQGDERLDKSAIKGLDEEIKKISSRPNPVISGGMTLMRVQQEITDALADVDATPTFETVAKNLKAYPATLNYSGSTLTSIVYDTGASTATKTLGYTGSNLTTIVLSGDIPAGIDTTKTLSYTGSNLTGVAYS